MIVIARDREAYEELCHLPVSLPLGFPRVDVERGSIHMIDTKSYKIEGDDDAMSK